MDEQLISCVIKVMSIMGKSAIIVGATGLIGMEVSRQLKNYVEFSSVKMLLRNKIQGFSNVEEIITDFNNEYQLKNLLKADVLFCCIGTTMTKAGSKEAFREIDFGLVLRIGKIARENGINHFILVSSIGAKATSRNFYLQVKGQIEEELKKLDFDYLSIFRPSFLLGPRKEFRLGELVGKKLMQVFQYFFIGKNKKYRPIKASNVAKAMIKDALNKNDRYTIYESDKIQELADK